MPHQQEEVAAARNCALVGGTEQCDAARAVRCTHISVMGMSLPAVKSAGLFAEPPASK